MSTSTHTLHARSRLSETHGFTLIELMLVVAIIGILSAIVIPRYKDSQTRARRTVATASLLQAAQVMERDFVQNNRYDKDRDISALSTDSYTLSIDGSVSNDDYFKIVATLASGISDSKCGNLALDSSGVKYAKDSNKSSSLIKECWLQ